MIHLDTHVAMWLWLEQLQRLPRRLYAQLDRSALGISPMVVVELAVLYESNRSTDRPSVIVNGLRSRLGVVIDPTPFEAVAMEAVSMTFTRDPFDRVIAAQARASGAKLATRDGLLREHLPEAIWD